MFVLKFEQIYTWLRIFTVNTINMQFVFICPMKFLLMISRISTKVYQDARQSTKVYQDARQSTKVIRMPDLSILSHFPDGK